MSSKLMEKSFAEIKQLSCVYRIRLGRAIHSSVFPIPLVFLPYESKGALTFLPVKDEFLNKKHQIYSQIHIPL